ncbi:MAG TPA: hypothetical protein VH138_01665 [Vicinamibacterales bacterium]|nr:hypothetical protein [Vicinamibacterales bacterium]
MKRVITATCFAMACAVGLAAQQTTGTTGATPDQSGQGRGPRTVTGCLRAGDTAGTYMLTDIQMGNRATTGTTAGGGTTATGGTTTTAGGGTTATGESGQRPTSLTLNPESSVDLKAHVGHKIEVTGTMEGGRRGGDTTSGTTGGTTTTGGGSTTTGGGTGQTTTGSQGRTGSPTMNVTSVRMISESCS